MNESLLLLADGRWPSGGYAHSGGLEAAVADGAVHDAATLESFVLGRLATTGAVDAWLAAAACRVGSDHGLLARLDTECEARILSPALRETGRRLGRGLVRSAASIWPSISGIPAVQHPVVLGAVVAMASGSPLDAARLALHSHLTAVVTAAPKLFSIDMRDAMAVAVAAAALVDSLAADALQADAAPALSAPLVERRAEQHARWEVRLFAS
jgi:urease accessory protein